MLGPQDRVHMAPGLDTWRGAFLHIGARWSCQYHIRVVVQASDTNLKDSCKEHTKRVIAGQRCYRQKNPSNPSNPSFSDYTFAPATKAVFLQSEPMFENLAGLNTMLSNVALIMTMAQDGHLAAGAPSGQVATAS